MKYCPKCNVNVHHQQNNCPLCGAYLDPTNDNNKYANYHEQDQLVKYPVLKENKEVKFFKSRFNILLLATLAFVIVIDLLTNGAITWSQYVIIGITLVLACVMLPINRKLKITQQIRLDLFMVTVASIFMELAICNWHFEWFVVEFVLPWVYVGAIVLVDFLIIFRHRKSRLFTTLMHCTFYSLLPQVALWIAQFAGWHTSLTITDSVIFFASLLHFVFVSVVLHKYLKEEMERRLSM